MLLGQAGTGKSSAITDIIEPTLIQKFGGKVNARGKVVVCATTGVASVQVDGVTIYSYTGIGRGMIMKL